MTAVQPEWSVQNVSDTSIALAGVVHERGESWQRCALRLERDPDDDSLLPWWSFSLVWTKGSRQAARWVASGLLLGGDSSWQVLTLTIEPVEGPQTGGAPTVTTHVLRELPLGLLHDALFELRVEQVSVAAAKMAGREGDLAMRIAGGYVPSLEVADSDTGELIDAPLPLALDLRFALRLVRESGVTKLTRERPRTDSGRPSEKWPTARPRGGRPPRRQEDLREFAEDFLAAGGNYEKVCEMRGKMPIETAKSWVQACRKEGWLAPGQPGRRGSAAAGWRLLGLRKAD